MKDRTKTSCSEFYLRKIEILPKVVTCHQALPRGLSSHRGHRPTQLQGLACSASGRHFISVDLFTLIRKFRTGHHGRKVAIHACRNVKVTRARFRPLQSAVSEAAVETLVKSGIRDARAWVGWPLGLSVQVASWVTGLPVEPSGARVPRWLVMWLDSG